MPQQKVRPKTKRRTLRQLQKLFYGGHCLSRRLFQCESSNELTDLELPDYQRFLDKVQTLEDLIEGLAELSPFADDALDVAESMTAEDFGIFKRALPNERAISALLKKRNDNQMTLVEVSGEEIPLSTMPFCFAPILLPSKFMEAHFVAERSAVSLSVAMIALLEERGTVHST